MWRIFRLDPTLRPLCPLLRSSLWFCQTLRPLCAPLCTAAIDLVGLDGPRGPRFTAAFMAHAANVVRWNENCDDGEYSTPGFTVVLRSRRDHRRRKQPAKDDSDLNLRVSKLKLRKGCFRDAKLIFQMVTRDYASFSHLH